MFMLNHYLELAKNTETIKINVKDKDLTSQLVNILLEKEEKEKMPFSFYGTKAALHHFQLHHGKKASEVMAYGIAGEVLEQQFKAEEYPVNMMNNILCVGQSYSQQGHSKTMKTICFFIELVQPKSALTVEPENRPSVLPKFKFILESASVYVKDSFLLKIRATVGNPFNNYYELRQKKDKGEVLTTFDSISLMNRSNVVIEDKGKVYLFNFNAVQTYNIIMHSHFDAVKDFVVFADDKKGITFGSI